jgi:integrase/recombinase XerD
MDNHVSQETNLTVKQALEPFLTYGRVERQYAAETQDKIKECFRSWLLPNFGDLHLTAIRPIHILSFRQRMTEANLSIARQYGLLVALKLFLKFCCTVLEINSLDPATIKLPRRKNPNVQYLTNTEIQAIRREIDGCRTLGLRLRALFETLLATGTRISEALSLNRNSISSQSKEALIMGKGSRIRTVFFSEEALKWINKYLSARTDNNPALFVTSGKNPRRVRRGDIPRYFKAVGKLAGIEKKVTPHLLRHTFCTNLRNNGADISLIKELAGHQDIQTTARYYLGSDKQILRDAVSRYLNYTEAGTSAPQS